MAKQMTVYLSGRIDDLTRGEAAEIRREATEIFEAAGWRVLDPMAGEARSMRTGTVVNAESRKRHGLTDEALVQRDEMYIKESDVVLILTGSISTWGTTMEWRAARAEYGKAVVAVDPEHKSRNHPWCKTHTAGFFDTVAEACRFCIEFFGA